MFLTESEDRGVNNGSTSLEPTNKNLSGKRKKADQTQFVNYVNKKPYQLKI